MSTRCSAQGKDGVTNTTDAHNSQHTVQTLQNAAQGVKHGRTTKEMKPRCDLAMLWSLRSHSGERGRPCTSQRRHHWPLQDAEHASMATYHLQLRVALQVKLLRDEMGPPNVQAHWPGGM